MCFNSVSSIYELTISKHYTLDRNYNLWLMVFPLYKRENPVNRLQKGKPQKMCSHFSNFLIHYRRTLLNSDATFRSNSKLYKQILQDFLLDLTIPISKVMLKIDEL